MLYLTCSSVTGAAGHVNNCPATGGHHHHLTSTNQQILVIRINYEALSKYSPGWPVLACAGLAWDRELKC